jgi:hypothetical protein
MFQAKMIGQIPNDIINEMNTLIGNNGKWIGEPGEDMFI